MLSKPLPRFLLLSVLAALLASLYSYGGADVTVWYVGLVYVIYAFGEGFGWLFRMTTFDFD